MGKADTATLLVSPGWGHVLKLGPSALSQCCSTCQRCSQGCCLPQCCPFCMESLNHRIIKVGNHSKTIKSSH